MLDEARIAAMRDGLLAVALQDDPVGEVLAEWDQPSGLHIRRVRTPLGVVGVIYERRPNVTADAGALCLKSGNAVLLRGGSESFHSSASIHDCLVGGLRAAGLPEAAIQLVPTRDRDAVGEMLRMTGVIDVLDVGATGTLRFDTNPYVPGVQSIPAPQVSVLSNFWRQ